MERIQDAFLVGRQKTDGNPADLGWPEHLRCEGVGGEWICLSLHREIDKIIQSFWNQINNKQKVSDNPLFHRQVYTFSIEEKDAVAIEGSISDLCNAIVFKMFVLFGSVLSPQRTSNSI